MAKISTETDGSTVRRRRGAGRAFLTALVCGSLTAAAAAQSVTDDFSDLNDTANPTWTHLDGVVGSTGQTWDASTGAYRLYAPPNSEVIEVYGYGFVGSYTGPQYTDVRATVDVVEIPLTMTSFGDIPGYFGVAVRLDGNNAPPTPGLGLPLRGFAYYYESTTRSGGEMVLAALIGDGLKDIGAQQLTIDSTKDYRLKLEAVGNVLRGQVYELNSSGQPVALVAEKIRDMNANPVGNVDHDGDDSTDPIPFEPFTTGYSGVFGVGATSFFDVLPADFTVDNFITESLTADFNASFEVNVDDLAAWKASVGVDAAGDADGDGDTDGADFLNWQRQFDPPSPAFPPPVAAVPEPAAWLLAAAGGAVLAWGRRRR